MSRTTHRAGGNCASFVDGLEPRRLFAADFVLDWNAIALQAVANDYTPSVVATPDQAGPTGTARALAIVQAAVFDAVNSIDGSYQPYLVSYRGYDHASIGAAVSQAAHDTLSTLYPHQCASFDKALRVSLSKIPDGQAERQGVELGGRVARLILHVRQHDGSDASMPYSEPTAPGVWETYPGEKPPLATLWGDVTPFVLKSASQFPVDPPPALDSAAYAAAYQEVKDYGGDGITTPTLRTPEQTEIGLFWAYDGTPEIGTPPRFFNRITQTIARQEENTEVENARLFALVNLAVADAGITCWGAKYDYDLWRPIRGIRQEDAEGYSLDDGNPATEADPTWTPLGSPYTNGDPGDSNFTPNFPSYTSGHATFGGAFFEVLKRFYGTDDITFTVTSDELNGVSHNADGTVRPLSPRTFTSFSQAAEENGQSRIYLGVHWSFDKVEGIKQGTSIGDYTFDHILTPVRPRPTHDDRAHGDHHDHDGGPTFSCPAARPADARTTPPSSTRWSLDNILASDDADSVLA
jgi:hypothetical protein